MAVYLFTFHAYRSWMPDRRRGYVQRKRGILKADPAMADNYRRRALFEPVRFDDHDCQTLLNAAQTLCQSPARAGWRLHIGVAVFNHLHLLVSWRGYVAAKRAKAGLHRALTVELRDRHDAPPGRPWLSRHGSIKRITTRRHFEHLLRTYLPSHRKYGGALLIPSA